MIVVSINFFCNSWNKFFQDTDHVVKIIKFILSDFGLFEVNSINVSVNFSIDSIFFSFSN